MIFGPLSRIAKSILALSLSFVMAVGTTLPSKASPVVEEIQVGLSAGGYRDIVAAGTKLFVLNGSNIKVIDTSSEPHTISTIDFSSPALDGALARGVYVATDQSVWVTSYRMGPDVISGGVTAREGGEVIRIDARTNTVTHRFCALSGSGLCTLSPNLEAATGITAEGQFVYVAMQAFDDTRDSILVFDIGSMSSTQQWSRLDSQTCNIQLLIAGQMPQAFLLLQKTEELRSST